MTVVEAQELYVVWELLSLDWEWGPVTRSGSLNLITAFCDAE